MFGGKLMSHWKSFGSAILVALGLLGETAGSAQAQCNDGCATEWSGGSAINLGVLPSGEPGTPFSAATGINNAGQAVGYSSGHAVEWNAGRINDLGFLPGYQFSVAQGINNIGQVVGARLCGRI